MSTDPALYVPRIASEWVLSRLQEHVERGGPVAVLLGPPGIGKSMLLRVLRARLAPRRASVHVPHASFGPDEVSGWILGLLAEPATGAPDEALVALAGRLAAQGSGLALLVDEAASIPPETAAHLAGLVRRVHPGASLVFTGVDDRRMAAVCAGLEHPLLRVRYDEPMSREECGRHALSLLARDLRPERRAEQPDEAALGRLAEACGGNPAILEELVERRAWAAPTVPAAAQST